MHMWYLRYTLILLFVRMRVVSLTDIVLYKPIEIFYLICSCSDMYYSMSMTILFVIPIIGIVIQMFIVSIRIYGVFYDL